MKKFFLATALIIGLGFMQVNAQVNFGIKAEANLSNFLLTDMAGAESNFGVGASLGAFTEFEFGEHFALQPELLFHYKTSELKDGASIDYQYFGAEIPIYAVGKVNLGAGKAYLGAGPYFGVGFDAKYKAGGSDINLYKDKVLQRFDLGAGVMLGYEFGFGLQINAGYKMGFFDAVDAESDIVTMRNEAISLGLAYKF